MKSSSTVDSVPDPETKTRLYESMAGGLTAIWARENTRESLWDAMARKEVYATTGTRLRVRVFGGWKSRSGGSRAIQFCGIWI